MGWLQLDPANLAARVRDQGAAARVPSPAASLLRGMLGFAFVSVAGFAPWALAGRWFYRNTGEVGLYAICALVFVGLSGLVLDPLILGASSLGRFYRLFGVAFSGYALLWILGWMALRGNRGGIVGLLAGTAWMAWVLTSAFEARGAWPRVALALFALNAVGYFAGGWVEARIASAHILALSRSTQMALAKLAWGWCYGMGLGAGLGFAFHACQAEARALIAARAKAT
jgi:hypothetical protein